MSLTIRSQRGNRELRGPHSLVDPPNCIPETSHSAAGRVNDSTDDWLPVDGSASAAPECEKADAEMEQNSALVKPEATEPRRPLVLLDLPDELLDLAFSFVIRPSDLISLCLTCRKTQTHAVAPLYRTITLDLGSENDHRIPSLLNPSNPGLKHIRNVELYRADVIHNCNQIQQASLACRMLLEFLPRDSLEKFSWHPWSPFSSKNFKLLHERQKKLRWLEAIAIDEPIDDKFLKSLKLDSTAADCTKLGLYPDSRETLRLCGALLKNSPKVAKVTIHTNFEDAEPSIPTSELNDTAVGLGLVTSSIFAHMLPFDKCTPIVLNELTLQKVHLRFAGESYCRVINFPKLRTLRIFGCVGADSLFSELSKGSKLPERLETLEFKHEDDHDGEALSAIEIFLTLVSGLKNLALEIATAKALPTVASLTRHARTLQLLNVHAYDAVPSDGDEDEHVYSTQDFAKICKDCTNLEQLSIAFPSTSLLRGPTDEFDGFLTAIKRLPQLVTLNITTWPTTVAPGSGSTPRIPRKQYEALLQGLAQHILERCAAAAKARTDTSEDDAAGGDAAATSGTDTTPTTAETELSTRTESKINVVAFGSAERIFEREDGKHCIVYLRGNVLDSLGRKTVSAVPVGWCLRKYAEPKSDVLDFSLMRSMRPPTRELVPSDEDDNGWP